MKDSHSEKAEHFTQVIGLCAFGIMSLVQLTAGFIVLGAFIIVLVATLGYLYATR